MYAHDVVTTALTLSPEDLRAMAKLPKTAVLNAEVTVRKRSDGEVYSIIVSFEQYKYRKLKGEK